MIKTHPGSEPYQALAAIYDLTGQSRFSLKMVGYALELLALHRIRPINVVDLACGTGAAAVALARRKFQVSGVDGSTAMLARAEARARKWEVNVEWLNGDLTELGRIQWENQRPPFDFALCLYDSLNHLTDPNEFSGALAAVAGLLKTGGHFFFDVNTPYAYSTAWGNAQDTYVGADYARYWRSQFEPATGLATLHATYFFRSQSTDEQWQRIDTRQTARGYDQAIINTALAQAGLRPLVAYEALTFAPIRAQTYRAAYLVEKA